MAAGREDEPKGRLELYRRLGGPDAGRGARRLPPIRPADDRAADAAPGPGAAGVRDPRGALGPPLAPAVDTALTAPDDALGLDEGPMIPCTSPTASRPVR